MPVPGSTRELINTIVQNPYGYNSLAPEDMLAVWQSFGDVLKETMESGKGCSIPGLGTFTFTSQRVDFGNRYKLETSPAFYLAEKFSRTHGVRCKQPNPTGSIPVVPINFSAIGQRCGASRSVVQSVLKDLLVVVADFVHMKKTCELDMGVGRLEFRGGAATMKWNASFLRRIATANDAVVESSRPTTASAAIRGANTYRTQRAQLATTQQRQRPSTAGARPSSGQRTQPRPSSGRPSSGQRPGTARPRPGTAGQRGARRPSSASTQGSRRDENGGFVYAGEERQGLQRATPVEDVPLAVTGMQASKTLPRVQNNTREAGHYHGPRGNDPDVCKICTSRDIQLVTRRNMRNRELQMDRSMREMFEEDAKIALEKEREEALARRRKTEEVQAFNAALMHDRQRQRQYMAEYERYEQEAPILGNRPVTPPGTERARQYNKSLEEQIALRDAMKQRAIDEEVAYATMSQALMDRELDEEEARWNAERMRKQQETRDALAIQVRMKAIQREEEMNDGDEWLPTITRADSALEHAEKRRQTTMKNNAEMHRTLNEKRKRDAELKQREIDHETREMDRIAREVANEKERERAKKINTRRQLEESWAEQTRLKKAMAAADAYDGPLCTSLQLECEADVDWKCKRCGRPMPDGIQTNAPKTNRSLKRRFRLTGF